MAIKYLLVLAFGCCMFGALGAEGPTPAFEKAQSASFAELEYMLWSGDEDEFKAMLFELTRRRTEEGCELMIKYLRKQSAQLPKELPSMEETKKLETDYMVTGKPPSANHWTQAFGRAVRTAKRLVLLDMPAADEATKEFREELTAKWKGSEAGDFLLKSIQMEYEQAKEDVRTGAVPWTRAK